jgi:hypothetical protein
MEFLSTVVDGLCFLVVAGATVLRRAPLVPKAQPSRKARYATW